MLEQLTDRWQARFANKLLLQAKKEIGHASPRRTIRLVIAQVLAASVLMSPFIVMGAGVLLIALAFPEVFPVVLGLILVGFGYVLLPPRARNVEKTYRRDDLPSLFVLLDQIAHQLGTAPPDGIHVDSEFNAYMAQFRTLSSRKEEWVVGIGLPLWAALPPDGCLALLAHELAHRVNDDPARQGVLFNAKTVLFNWYDTFYLDENGFDSRGAYHWGSDTIFQRLIAGMISMVYALLTRLTFFESQRAEYRADALASRVAGKTGITNLLETITRAELASRSVVDLYPYRKNRNGRIFDHMGQAVAQADKSEVSRFLKKAKAERRCVDTSHPPTAMRIEFADALPEDWGQDSLDPTDVDLAAIDRELQPIKDRFGKELMEDLYEAEVNR